VEGEGEEGRVNDEARTDSENTMVAGLHPGQ
jgi:hypothetical protein